jgi:flagellar protein FliO/FliZ
VFALLAPTAVTAPARLNTWGANAPSPLADIGQLAVSLLIVIVLIVIAGWLFRRMRGVTAGGANPLRVVGQLTLGRRERVVLIEAGDKQVLLGVAPGRVQALHVLDERVEPPEAPPSARTFSDILDLIKARGRKQ